MYTALKDLFLRLMKVPAEPDDPMGNVKSLRVFRASIRFFWCGLILWGLKMLGSALGAVIFVVVLSGTLNQTRLHGLTLIVIALAVLYVVVTCAVSLFLLRLDYELRWYKLSDRSLRIREGVLSVREITMTYANIQNITISQGPLQRLFKIADVKVDSAGGGMAFQPQQGPGRLLEAGGVSGGHTAFFRGVDNAQEIAALVRERQKHFAESGLGDHDDKTSPRPAETAAPGIAAGLPDSLIPALEALRAETRLLAAAAAGLPGKN
jgi:membrane protein YdbS with pleckstrin-like domain